MTRITNGSLQTLVIGLFAISGLAAANPMASFVDCSDSFWEVACQDEFTPAGEIDVTPGEWVQIDNNPVCTTLDSGYIVCHT